MAYEIATGGSPVSYMEHFKNYPFLYGWLLCLHVYSWLMVPVLIAAAIDAAHVVHQKKREENQRALRKIMADKILRVNPALGHSQVEGLIEEALEEMKASTTKSPKHPS